MKAIIFDMYGVVIKDPDGLLMPFINNTFPHLTGEDIFPAWRKMDSGEITPLDFWMQLGFTGEHEKVDRAYLDSIRADDEFFEVAPRLQTKYRLALLSNDVSAWSAFVREKFDLSRYFETSIISGDVGMRKPNPEIYKLMLDALKLPAEECMFIDDRRRNLDAAQALGMRVVLFKRGKKDYAGESIGSFKELLTLLEV